MSSPTCSTFSFGSSYSSSTYSSSFTPTEYSPSSSAASSPPHHRRKNSAAQNAAMRAIIQPWAGLSATPPGCRAVSFSSWTRFSASYTSSKSSDELKMSNLWAARGTTADYNPPILERTYLGVEQLEPVGCGKPKVREYVRPKQPVQRQQGSTSSWATTSTTASSPLATEPITFTKKEVKSKPVTNSLLTTSIVYAPPEPTAEEVNEALEEKAKEHGIELSTSQLPDAWGSDSEEEDETEVNMKRNQRNRYK